MEGLFNMIEANTHLVRLIHWLIDEVLSAGGDGDAFLLSKTYPVDELKASLLEALKTHDVNRFWTFRETENIYSIGHSQESLVVYFNTINNMPEIPSWAQCVVKI